VSQKQSAAVKHERLLDAEPNDFNKAQHVYAVKLCMGIIKRAQHVRAPGLGATQVT